MSAFLSEGIHVFVRCVLAGWIWHARVYPMKFKFCFSVLIRPPSAFLGFFKCKHRPQWNHRWLPVEWHAAGSSSQISRCPDETWLGPNWGKTSSYSHDIVFIPDLWSFTAGNALMCVTDAFCPPLFIHLRHRFHNNTPKIHQKSFHGLSKRSFKEFLPADRRIICETDFVNAV